MNYMNFFIKNKKPHLKWTEAYPNSDICILEDFSFEQKLEIIEPYFSNCSRILLKIFFWEKHNNFCEYLSTFDIKNIELIKHYKGRTLPGILLISFDKYEKIFIRNLLLCHFNSDFSINPKLNIHPHFLIEYDNLNITILDIYDDRGMYILKNRDDIGE